MEVFNIRNQKVAIGEAGRTPEDPVFVASNSDGASAFARLCAHSRKFERQHVDYPVTIRLVSNAGVEFDRGRATIRNMTPEGAFIGDLELVRGVVPVDSFNLHFRVEEGDLKGVEGSCRPVRIAAGEKLGFGVTFKQVYVKILGDDLQDDEFGKGPR